MLEEILEKYQDVDFLIADGFDNAIIGFDDKSYRLIYSVTKCINVLINENDMDEEEALDYFYYNVSGAYVGEKTPIFCDDLF